jgi:hypothetical protein
MHRLSLSSWSTVAPVLLVLACGGDDVGLTEAVSTGGGSSGGTTQGPTSDPTTGPGPTTSTSPTTGPGPTTEASSSTGTTETTSVDPSTSTGAETTGGPGSCCDPQAGPGCPDPEVQACVCAQDPFCCEDTWDFQCTGEVVSLGCGTCEFDPQACCQPLRGGGCAADPSLTLCVCMSDSACCTDAWDAGCVDLIEKSGCGSCGGQAGDCCAANEGPSCEDGAVAACVCAALPGCCEQAWTEECVLAVDGLGCGMCGEPPPEGPCCEAGQGPGCLEDEVEACVCAAMPDCCAVEWTLECAAAVQSLGCGDCGIGECCTEQPGPGCGQPDIEACVCGQDPFCCEQQWDMICADNVEGFGCGMCSGMGGECCEAGMGPGCNDLGVQTCVCEAAPSCCETVWSDACAALVEPLGCGMCASNSTGCCEPHDTPSCDDQAVADCVCAQDTFCCTDAWDDLCVNEVIEFGCGVC